MNRFSPCLAGVLLAIAVGAAGETAPGTRVLEHDVEPPPPGIAGSVCAVLGKLAWPIFEPLTVGAYDSTAWSRDRRYCTAVLVSTSMAAAAVGVNEVGHPRRPAVFGAGSVDRFFRDALRSRCKTDNFFAGDLGSLWAPLAATGALVVAAVADGAPGGRSRLGRAVPLLWLGIGGNGLFTGVFKKSFGRERPYLAFNNERAIEKFGTGDDAHESFYSGHASTAFFTAAFADPVLADLLQARWPGYRLWEPRESPLDAAPTWPMRVLRLGQGLALYGLAAAVAHSRIEIDQHFMTDVVVGALVGAAHGRLLYRWGYRHRGDRGDRRPMVAAVPGGGGLALTWRF